MMSLLHKMLSVNLFLKSCFPFVSFSFTIMCYKVMILLQFMLISSFSCRLQNFYIFFFFFFVVVSKILSTFLVVSQFHVYFHVNNILFTYYSCRFSILVSSAVRVVVFRIVIFFQLELFSLSCRLLMMLLFYVERFYFDEKRKKEVIHIPFSHFFLLNLNTQFKLYI